MREMSDHVFDLMSIEFGSLGKSILLDLVKQRSGVSTHLSHSVIANCRTIFLTQAANCELAELVCAMVIQFTSSFVEIILLSTAEEHQRQGYGRSMVCLAAEIAKGVGNPRLVIDGIKSSEGFWSKPHLVSSTLMGLSPSVLTACWPQLGQDQIIQRGISSGLDRHSVLGNMFTDFRAMQHEIDFYHDYIQHATDLMKGGSRAESGEQPLSDETAGVLDNEDGDALYTVIDEEESVPLAVLIEKERKKEKKEKKKSRKNKKKATRKVKKKKKRKRPPKKKKRWYDNEGQEVQWAAGQRGQGHLSSPSSPEARAQEEVQEDVRCEECGRGDSAESMLLCGDGYSQGCDKGFHIYCLKPALSALPKGIWCCKDCSAGDGAGKREIVTVAEKEREKEREQEEQEQEQRHSSKYQGINKVKYQGITQVGSNKWRVRIYHHGEAHLIGFYVNEREAARACDESYERAAEEDCGSKGPLDFAVEGDDKHVEGDDKHAEGDDKHAEGDEEGGDIEGGDIEGGDIEAVSSESEDEEKKPILVLPKVGVGSIIHSTTN
jgi:hypothetical protein